MKKFLIFVTLSVVGISYVKTTYSIADVVAYTQKKPHPKYSPMAQYWIGWYLEINGRYTEGAGVLEAELETWPENNAYLGESIFKLGECYEGMRQRDKAKEKYEQYITDYPNGKNVSLAQRKLELFRSN